MCAADLSSHAAFCYYCDQMAARQDKRSAPDDRPRTTTALRQAPLPPGDDIGAAEMGRRVAVSLREKRKARSMSLDQLAVASGVSGRPCRRSRRRRATRRWV